MIRRPPRSTRTDTLFPYTTLFRSIASMARRVGMGQKFALPFPSQSFGTVPDPAWKLKKYGQQWQVYDTVNATIGQGYMLINPLQMAVMAARLATGRPLMPNFIHGADRPEAEPVGVNAGPLVVIRAAMSAVVPGRGKGGAARMNNQIGRTAWWGKV